ncbi:BrnA antitoxin family protein [candidate division KSB1 bacterium]|nr:BrnA antitoxin family protein [candidate division KSB1 bacterium]
MAKSKRERDPIPEQFSGFDELANFWETHDLTDYEDQLQEVDYKVARKPTRQFVVTLSDELTKALWKATHREGVSMQTLVNLWVQERLQQYQTASS